MNIFRQIYLDQGPFTPIVTTLITFTASVAELKEFHFLVLQEPDLRLKKKMDLAALMQRGTRWGS